MGTDSKNPETSAVHAGWRRDKIRTAVAVPIYQTPSYQFHDTQHAPNMFGQADTVMSGRYGSLLGFELKDSSKEAEQAPINSLQPFYHVANIGDARSPAIRPATTSRSQLSPEKQVQTGFSEAYARLSFGIEHVEDIIANPDQAQAAVCGDSYGWQ